MTPADRRCGEGMCPDRNDQVGYCTPGFCPRPPGPEGSQEITADQRSCAMMHEIVDRLQMAPCGNTELDGLIDQALSAVGQLAGASWLSVYVAGHGGGWSSDLGQALTLLPEGYNFSLGLRDGIYWAWIQPNDRWEPGENESRHDHPLGSGLLVGYTATLALSAAAIMLWARRIKVRAA